MSTVPPLIVTLGGAMFTFPPGKEVTVGRGEASDVRIPDAGPGTKHVVSRLHLIIRVDPGVGQWVAIDKSRNGIFANRTRVPSAVISDDLTLAVGAPDGPQLHFRTATQVIPVAKFRPPPAQAAPPRPPQTVAQQQWPTPQQPAPRPPAPQRPAAPAPQRSSGPPAGAVTIGRHSTAAIKVEDSLASRIHAYLVAAPTGTQLYDNGSGNGTFVNGHRVDAVTLRPGDVITVGNTDLVFTGGTAVQSRLSVATGGIEVRLEEHVASAYWRVGETGDMRLVNRYGEVFSAASNARMPVFSGPEGSSSVLLARFDDFSRQLGPLGKSLVGVSMSAREAWQLKLDDGLTIELGHDQVKAPTDERLARFVRNYPKAKAQLNMNVAVVDLRYPSGFALRPAPSPAPVGKQDSKGK